MKIHVVIRVNFAVITIKTASMKEESILSSMEI